MMKRGLIPIYILILLSLIGCSKEKLTMDTYTWDDHDCTSVFKNGDKVIKEIKSTRNLFVQVYHKDGIAYKQSLVEEHFFDKESVSLLKSLKDNFEHLEQSTFSSEDGVKFEYVVSEYYLKVSIIIDFEKIKFNDINTDLSSYIGVDVILNEDGQVSFDKLSNRLIDIGFRHEKM